MGGVHQPICSILSELYGIDMADEITVIDAITMMGEITISYAGNMRFAVAFSKMH